MLKAEVSRADFLKLTKLDPEGLKSRARRGQLPLPQTERQRNTYGAFEALLTLIVDDLAQALDCSLVKVSNIIHAHALALSLKWPEISHSSEDLFNGIEADEVLFGLLSHPVADQSHRYPYVLGTLDEIYSELKARPPVVRMVVLNVSRAAAVLRMRAAREEIDLGDFWAAPPADVVNSSPE